MHSSRMHTIRSSSRLLGGLPQCILGYAPLGLEMPPGLSLENSDPTSQTPWVWAWRPHPARPPNLLPGYGPGDPPARPPNLPPRYGPGDPPCGQNDRHV